MSEQPYVLVLYYSVHGSVKRLAEEIATGIESAGIEARFRTVPSVSSALDYKAHTSKDNDDAYASLDDLRDCSGLALGSPTRFGNMAAAIKYFIDGSTPLWLNASLENKPAIVFTSSSTLHGGNTTLMSMAMPLLHHGMMLLGTPISENAVHETDSGGTLLGPSHVTFDNHDAALSEEEIKIARASGKRLGQTALKLLA